VPEGGAGRPPSAGPAADAALAWEFWVDRGGTFTDCIGVDPGGRLHTAKLLSSDDAPIEGIREILRAAGADPDVVLPECTARLGSTVATNALLERRGVRTLLVGNDGLTDVFRIGTQQRPHLFELEIVRAPPLHERAVVTPARIDAQGSRVRRFDEAARAALREALRAARRDGLSSVAIALAHAYLDPQDEQVCAEMAREEGFEHVVASHAIAHEQGLLARGETAVVDAYLTPLLRRHVDRLSSALPGARLRFMQSSGGLTDARRFRGPTRCCRGPPVASWLRHALRVTRAFAARSGSTWGGPRPTCH